MKESVLVILDGEPALWHARPENSQESLDVFGPGHATVRANHDAGRSSTSNQRLDRFFEPVEDRPVVVRRDGGETPCAG
jgi:hypothetical protein